MYNHIVLIGRVGKDAEPRFMSDGQNGVINFSLATSRRWRDKEGNWQDKTQWHNIVHWGKYVKAVAERVKKGHLIMVEGELQYRKWEDKDGNSHDITEINAVRVISLEKREKSATPQDFEQSDSIPPTKPEDSQTETEDDLPF
jgi:single-strand DNA-binding protein